MKKIFTTGILILAMATGAMAEDYSFEPVEISTPAATTPVTPASAPAPATNTLNNANTMGNPGIDNGFQNALLQLDSAQVDMRDKLLEYKSQYTEVDAQYNKYKTERANLNKTIKQFEKKIKNIDKYKKNIRKDMM